MSFRPKGEISLRFINEISPSGRNDAVVEMTSKQS